MRYYFLIPLILLLLAISPQQSFAKPSLKDMVKIKKGCFMMGTDKKFFYETDWENSRERPVHKVCLSSFYLDKYETSQKDFQNLMGYNNSIIKNESHPVDHINWDEATLYCKRSGKRLPTEAEWEYAARAGSTTINPWGDGIDWDYLWYENSSARQQNPRGTKKPNAWGVHDMMGSLWEWVSDWYSETYYAESPKNNPTGPKKRQSARVIRGASWVDDESYIRVTIRFPGMTDPTEHFLTGFRCAYSPDKKKK
ncbi:MAG: formylglycine-generating enzyme family protein [Nitrospinales bacterium]